MNKEFISNTVVPYYLLSTDGKRHGHLSKQVIASILHSAPETPVLLKDYDISELKDIGVFIGDEYE